MKIDYIEESSEDLDIYVSNSKKYFPYQYSNNPNTNIQQISMNQQEQSERIPMTEKLDVEILERKLNEIELLIQEKSLIVQQIEQLKLQLSLVDKRITTLESEVLQGANLSHEEIFKPPLKQETSNRGPLHEYTHSGVEENKTRNKTATISKPINKSIAPSVQAEIPIRTTSRSPARSNSLNRISSLQTERNQSPTRVGSIDRNPTGRSTTPNGRGNITPTRSNSFTSRTPVISKMPTKTPNSSSRNIFDRLTDPSLYTGTHKERFDAFGRGRGLAGRREFFKNGIPFDEVFPKSSPNMPTPKKMDVIDDPAAKVMFQSILKVDPNSFRSSQEFSRSSSREDLFQ